MSHSVEEKDRILYSGFAMLSCTSAALRETAVFIVSHGHDPYPFWFWTSKVWEMKKNQKIQLSSVHAYWNRIT